MDDRGEEERERCGEGETPERGGGRERSHEDLGKRFLGSFKTTIFS